MNKLNMISPFNTMSYGYVGCFLFEELSKLIDVKPNCISQFSAEPRFNYIKPKVESFRKEFHHDAPSLKVWHQFDMTGFTGSGPTIGFPIFELNKFNEIEKHNLQYPDHLIVCSEWAKKVIIDQCSVSEDTVHVVPLGVDRGVFGDVPANNDGPTRFVNYGKWEIRKGHDVLIKAFNDAFEPSDDVELHMFSENVFLRPHQSNEWMNYYVNTKLGNKIRFGKRVETQEQVYNIMKEMDCGVFPARAEGWNLELLEMMSCGKEVIATNVTGHTEFCNNKNSMLIDLPGLEPAYDGVFFNGQGDWHKIENENIDQISEYMRAIHKKKQRGELNKNEEGIKTASDFTWKESAQKLLKVIKQAGS